MPESSVMNQLIGYLLIVVVVVVVLIDTLTPLTANTAHLWVLASIVGGLLYGKHLTEESEPGIKQQDSRNPPKLE